MNQQAPWTEEEIDQNREFQLRLAQATPRVFITPAIVVLNVLVFLAMVVIGGLSPLSPTTDGLVKWGANFGPLITQGEWWRLLMATFIHVGLIHLGMNMFVLYGVGIFTERLFGNFGFLVLYLLSGLGGSLTSVWWKPFTVSAGASGAVFGVYGAFLGYLLIQRHFIPQKNLSSMLKNALSFLGFNLIYGFSMQNIDMVAHLGGFVTGFVLGCVMARPLTASNTGALTRSAIVLVVGTVLAAAAATRLPRVDDLGPVLHSLATLETSSEKDFNEALAKVQAKQSTGAEFYDLMHQKIIPPWNAKRDQISKLRLIGRQEEVANKLLRYMSLRSEAWGLIADGVKLEKPDLLNQGVQKQLQAMALVKSIAPGTSSPSRPRKPRDASKRVVP